MEVLTKQATCQQAGTRPDWLPLPVVPVLVWPELPVPEPMPVLPVPEPMPVLEPEPVPVPVPASVGTCESMSSTHARSEATHVKH